MKGISPMKSKSAPMPPKVLLVSMFIYFSLGFVWYL
jgi:hypothetical protein